MYCVEGTSHLISSTIIFANIQNEKRLNNIINISVFRYVDFIS